MNHGNFFTYARELDQGIKDFYTSYIIPVNSHSYITFNKKNVQLLSKANYTI